MAIEVKTSPDGHSSVHGDLLYVVYEATKANDPVTYPDYRYIADVYVDTELVTRVKAYPDPTTKMGIFNLSNIFRNYIAPEFKPDIGLFEVQQMGDRLFNVSGTVRFGEEYDFVLYPFTIAQVGQKFYGHYNGRLIGTYTNLPGDFDNYASNRPLVTNIYRGTQHHFIPFHRAVDVFNPVAVTIITYDSNNTQIGVSSFSLPFITYTGSMRIFDIGVAGIEAAGLTITDDVAYYTISADNNVLRVNLVCEMKHTVYTVTFLNKYGGFESRDFTKLSRKLIDIEKRDFGKLPYTVNASGQVSYYNSNNVYNEQRSVYSSQYREKMTLNTDVMTDAEYTWLGDLILSPMAFIEMLDAESNPFFIPIVITGTNYEFRKTINDKVTALTISVEFGDQFSAQYR